jgi:hypothetical protein
MRFTSVFLGITLGSHLGFSVLAADSHLILTRSELRDRIHGGFLGQVLGNLNGLPHEMKYIHEPGQVERYVPGLPEGARTDDDTDLEWVYVKAMQNEGVFLPPARIRELWRRHINRGIWCANLYARQLMELGLEPPLTGRVALNPWSEFNISGQFICESFGLMAPGMPQTASRIGLHYTQVTIDGEPAQTTQLFCSLIALAFTSTNIQTLLDLSLTAVDPNSEIAAVARDVRTWHQEHPSDWRETRRRIKEKYQRHNGEMRDKNGYELNTASTIAALLHGQADLPETLRLAFNFGWDCDNNAATAATVLGVMRGRSWMQQQGWNIKDSYRNTTRDAMPTNETLTGFADRIVDIARSVILSHGGAEFTTNGESAFRIPIERPSNLAPLPRPLDRRESLRAELLPQITRDLEGSATDQARAAYLALCLEEDETFAREKPEEWTSAIASLKQATNVVAQIFAAPAPSASRLQARARHHALAPPN